ncbi:MAG TPA: ArgE/DapE family deacylase [Gemmatimonadota bacterium]|jgi:acetylornithine deacetylase|nr:ArgE/DapE family deacylase [Gemmatimonadota bacterium]
MPTSVEAITALLTELVAVESVNPAFTAGRTSEARLADLVARRLEEAGLRVERREPDPGRVSVLGTLAGTGQGPSLMLYAHLDTVGVEGMERPFEPVVRDGRLYGRGAYDMKGGLAACLAAVQHLIDGGRALAGDVIVAAVADEEVASLGMADVLTAVVPDAAIVTEPTELEICLAHKGFAWFEVTTKGRAAHGSRFEEGIDANLQMGRFLARLDALERELRARAPHPLVGPPSLHAAVLQGGTGPSTYADRCRLTIERRTVPGESADEALAEIHALLDRLHEEDPFFDAHAITTLARDPFESDADRPVTNALAGAATTVLGRRPPFVGRPYWMDAALLGAAGVDTVVMGPTGAGAHAAVEWVEIASVAQLADILSRAAIEFCGTA